MLEPEGGESRGQKRQIGGAGAGSGFAGKSSARAGAAWVRMENPGCRSARVELELWLDRPGSGQRQVRTGVLAPGESRTFFLGRAEGVRPGRLEARGIF